MLISGRRSAVNSENYIRYTDGALLPGFRWRRSKQRQLSIDTVHIHYRHRFRRDVLVRQIAVARIPAGSTATPELHDVHLEGQFHIADQPALFGCEWFQYPFPKERSYTFKNINEKPSAHASHSSRIIVDAQVQRSGGRGRYREHALASD